MTINIQLFGAPGAGKSTTTAELFVKLKRAGRKVEYLQEYAKQLVYHGRWNTLKEQNYIFAKQTHHLDAISQSVDIVVTDSPLLLSALYAPTWYPPCFTELVKKVYSTYHNINIFVNRVKPYATYGRTQTEEESNKLAIEFKHRLKDEFNIHFVEVDGDELAADKILAILAKEEEKKCS